MGRIQAWIDEYGAVLVGTALCFLFYVCVIGPVLIHAPEIFHLQAHSTRHANIPASQGTDDALATYTLWLVIFTAILAISTIGLWAVTAMTLRHAKEDSWRQANNMRASISAANASAFTAEQSVRDARASSERQLRAYVYVSKVSYTPEEITIWIKNFGETPAHNLCFWYATEVRREGDGLPEFLPKDRSTTKGSIAPSADFVVGGRFPEPIPHGSIGYLWGAIYYTDAFDQPRTTNFRYWAPRGAGPMATLDEGNHAT